MSDESSSSLEFDEEFRAQLERRILSYSQQEERLRVQVRELQDELEAVKRRRRSAEELYKAEFGEISSELRFVEQGVASQTEAVASRLPGPLTGLPWTAAIMRVLEREGGPLHVKKIWQRLAAGGFRTDAVDPVRSVVAIAVREPAIMKVSPNTYAMNGEYIVNNRLPGGNRSAGGEGRS